MLSREPANNILSKGIAALVVHAFLAIIFLVATILKIMSTQANSTHFYEAVFVENIGTFGFCCLTLFSICMKDLAYIGNFPAKYTKVCLVATLCCLLGAVVFALLGCNSKSNCGSSWGQSSPVDDAVVVHFAIPSIRNLCRPNTQAEIGEKKPILKTNLKDLEDSGPRP